MKKISIILISIAFLAAACGDGEDAFGPDQNASAGTMEEVTAVMVGSAETWITVDSARQIAVSTVDPASTKVADECTGELSEEEYQSTLTTVMAADLMNYEAPEEGVCYSTDSFDSFDVMYTDISGEIADLSLANCELSQGLKNFFTMLSTLAMKYGSECMSGAGSSGGGGGGADADVVIYDFPIVNPRDLPTPRRVTF